MRLLVTGGVGYIGAHLVRELIGRGDHVVVVDDLSTGYTERLPGVPVLQLDLAAADAAERLAVKLSDAPVDAIVHLAARKRVDESISRPEWYREQNVGGTAAVLEAARRAGVERVVFSSTAAVYASSLKPVHEDDVTAPVNPYGATKLAAENLVAAWATQTGGRAVSLRYFNVAGAADATLADRGSHNLVPRIYDRIAAGEAPRIYGDDYETADGTCIRDYVHVIDLAEAHVTALDYLQEASAAHRIYNVGTGQGTSVREMTEGMLRVARSDLRPAIEPRRPGDPAVVVADVQRIGAELGWRARFTVDDILESAWATRAT